MGAVHASKTDGYLVSRVGMRIDSMPMGRKGGQTGQTQEESALPDMKTSASPLALGRAGLLS